MKKLVSLLMALMMLASCSVAMADKIDEGFFEPMLLGSVEENGAYWNTGDVMRATFVASLLVDLVLANKETEADVLIDGAIAQNACYFGYDPVDDMITVIACGSTETLSIIYSPGSNLCNAIFTDSHVDPSGAEQFISILTESTGDTFYHVDGAAVYQYFDEIVNILTGE